MMENNTEFEFSEEQKQITKDAVAEVKKEKLVERLQDRDYVREQMDKSEKVKAAFDKIEFLQLTGEQKQEIAEKINKEVRFDFLYIAEVILSAAIVTLGLVQNSAAVVIGAMLIAPLLRPINGLGFGLARGGKKVFANSLRLLFVSVIVSLLISYFFTLIIGIEIENSEILARTNPNVIDFFIAIFSGVIGVLSLRYKRLGAGIAGVAMAVALLPPLCVIGIQLAFGNYDNAFGASLLFLSNVIGMILMSTIFFWAYGFTPHAKNLQNKVFLRLVTFIFCLILVLTPLSFSYTNFKNNNLLLLEIHQTVEKNLENKLENFSIEDLKIQDESENILNLAIKLKVDESAELQEILAKVKQELQKNFEKELKVEFEIVRIVEV